MPPFLVLGLPRSRTAWLAKFLTFGAVTCHHEPSIHWGGIDDLATFLAQPNTGASDTMLTWLAHEARKIRPDVNIIVVRRPRVEVFASILRLNYPVGDYVVRYHEKMDQRLDLIEDELNPYSVQFDDLNSPTVCGAIFKLCLGERMPAAWWEKWKDVNVQADISKTLKNIRENDAGVRAVYGQRHREIP